MFSDDTPENPQNEERSDPLVTAARLRQEAQAMRQQPMYATRGVRDITKDFVAASQKLPPGELVKDEYFTLFEAVGALEIMDPKMDSGCIPSGDSFEPEFDVCGGLDPAGVLWIMDELLRLEISFHDGYPLSQNLFTSLHVMRLTHPDNAPPYCLRFDGTGPDKDASIEEQLVHIVLRAYCIAIVKSVETVLEVIQSYTYYEEEDFVTYLFGRDLLPKMTSRDAVLHLEEAVDHVKRSDLPENMKYALTHRLTLRESLLTCLDAGDVEDWKQLWIEVESVDKPHALAKAEPDAFSDKVQRQLATSTPPRPMPQLTWQDACTKWKQLCQDVLSTFSSTSYPLRESPYDLQRCVWAFAYRKPAPTTFARAKMQEVLTKFDSVACDVPHFDLMLADIRDLVLAGDPLADPETYQVEAPTDPRHIASRVIEDFMEKAVGEYLNLYRMVCQNRCRMRRTFTQAVPLWDGIETDAREADRLLGGIALPRQAHNGYGAWSQLNPMTHWVRNHKLQIMQWIIQIGFETDLYLSREISDAYLTLREIASVRRDQLNRLKQLVEERCRYLETKGIVEYQEQCRTSMGFIKSLVLLSGVTVYMSEALSDLYGLLEIHGIVDTQKKPYEEDQLHYEARMKPFLGLTHDSIPDRNFFNSRKTTRRKVLVQALSEVDTQVKQARSSLTQLKLVKPEEGRYIGTEDRWKQEIKSLETVCVAISVATSQLQRIVEKTGKSPVEGDGTLKEFVEMTIPPPGTRYHDWWVVPRFRMKP